MKKKQNVQKSYDTTQDKRKGIEKDIVDGSTKREVRSGKGRNVRGMSKPYTKGPNDIAWRTNDTVMTSLVASLPFGKPAGLPITANLSSGLAKYTQPGVMTVYTYLTAGNATNYNSPINLAARKIYSYVRHANSGSKNYEAADMVNYFVSIGQVLGLLGFLQRALRTISEFSATNRYTPRALLMNMGLDADDLLTHIPQLKYEISWLGKAIGSLAFPDLPYFKACYEAFDYIFVDNDSPKEQFYMLCPYEIGIYNPIYDSNGGGVSFDKSGMTYSIPLPSSGVYLTYNQIHGLIRERMDVLLGDEDCGIISGDILKAFRDGGLYKPAALSLDYDLFQHSPEMLQQIHNLTIIDDDRFDFKGYHQNPGNPNTAPYIELDVANKGTAYSNPDDFCLVLTIDAFSRVPDPNEVVNCTVLNPQIATKAATGGGYEYDVTSCLFDLFLPFACTICEDVISATALNLNPYFRKVGGRFDTFGIFQNEVGFTNFDWHPLYWSWDSGTQALHALGDVQNVAMFGIDVATRIHENSMLNLFSFKDLNFY